MPLGLPPKSIALVFETPLNGLDASPPSFLHVAMKLGDWRLSALEERLRATASLETALSDNWYHTCGILRNYKIMGLTYGIVAQADSWSAWDA